MHQTDVSFKQSRRRRKKVDQGDGDEELLTVIVPASETEYERLYSECCKSSAQTKPSRPARKTGAVWRSATAKKERDALIKFYETIENTQDVISPESTSSLDLLTPGQSELTRSSNEVADCVLPGPASQASTASSPGAPAIDVQGTEINIPLTDAAAAPIYQVMSLQSAGAIKNVHIPAPPATLACAATTIADAHYYMVTTAKQHVKAVRRSNDVSAVKQPEAEPYSSPATGNVMSAASHMSIPMRRENITHSDSTRKSCGCAQATSVSDRAIDDTLPAMSSQDKLACSPSPSIADSIRHAAQSQSAQDVAASPSAGIAGSGRHAAQARSVLDVSRSPSVRIADSNAHAEQSQAALNEAARPSPSAAESSGHAGPSKSALDIPSSASQIIVQSRRRATPTLSASNVPPSPSQSIARSGSGTVALQPALEAPASSSRSTADSAGHASPSQPVQDVCSSPVHSITHSSGHAIPHTAMDVYPSPSRTTAVSSGHASPSWSAWDAPPCTSQSIARFDKDSKPMETPPHRHGGVMQPASTPERSPTATCPGLLLTSDAYHASGLLANDQYHSSRPVHPSSLQAGRSSAPGELHACITPQLPHVTGDAGPEKMQLLSDCLFVAPADSPRSNFNDRKAILLPASVRKSSMSTPHEAAVVAFHPACYATDDEVFSTPRLTLSQDQASSQDEHQSRAAPSVGRMANRSRADSLAGQPYGIVGAAGLPRASQVACPPSQSRLDSQQRRAKARASVSFSTRAGLPMHELRTPHGGPESRTSMSVRSSMLPIRPSQLALSDIHQSPGLSMVQAIPEADSAEQEASSANSAAPEPLTAVEQVLQACGQDCVGVFTKEMKQRYAGVRVRKLGEGSFKEVFLCGDAVVSVIPIEKDIIINDSPQPTALQILPELVAHTELSQLRQPTAPHGDPSGVKSLCSAFVNVMGCMLLRGEYYKPFAKAWKKFKATAPDAENDDPTDLPKDQLYLVLVSENGGQALEDVLLHSFDEARSIMLQVALALAVAETCHEFEHRDLHWGNILIKQVDQENHVQRYQLNGQEYKVNSYGNQVCIIDYTLCRLTSPQGDILASKLDQEGMEWLFENTGVQGDAYRGMKSVAERTWETLEDPDMHWENFTPGTNVVWLGYLCVQLQDNIVVKGKSGQDERAAMNKKEKQSWDAFRRACRSSKYSASCVELIKHPFFKNVIVA
eukprot:jgi/Ulvmu1/4065/UM019_0043.1